MASFFCEFSETANRMDSDRGSLSHAKTVQIYMNFFEQDLEKTCVAYRHPIIISLSPIYIYIYTCQNHAMHIFQ